MTKRVFSYLFYTFRDIPINTFWTVVVAKLAEQLLLTEEVRGSTPVNGKFLSAAFIYTTVLKRQN